MQNKKNFNNNETTDEEIVDIINRMIRGVDDTFMDFQKSVYRASLKAAQDEHDEVAASLYKGVVDFLNEFTEKCKAPYNSFDLIHCKVVYMDAFFDYMSVGDLEMARVCRFVILYIERLKDTVKKIANSGLSD